MKIYDYDFNKEEICSLFLSNPDYFIDVIFRYVVCHIVADEICKILIDNEIVKSPEGKENG